MNEEYYNFTVKDIITDIFFHYEDGNENYPPSKLYIKINPEYSRHPEYQFLKIGLILMGRFRETYAASPLNTDGDKYIRHFAEGLNCLADFQSVIDNGDAYGNLVNNQEDNSLIIGNMSGYFESESTMIRVYVADEVGRETVFSPHFKPPLHDLFHLGTPSGFPE